MAKRTPRNDDPTLPGPDAGGATSRVPLHEAASVRYLNYALSVITSRALPDVRDGLKPVQRRILYAMWTEGPRPDQKPRKCATVCGSVMGKYHPHGDSAIYDALVRMAQPWVMRLPLVEGHGNFGSMDGDPPAAYRYTECRLDPAAAGLLEDLSSRTVAYRPNYDGSKEEPVVLPARLPALLINGSQGIAVGMATSIPPHNPAEVGKALLKLLKNPEATVAQLTGPGGILAPDFPTGGTLVTPQAEIKEIYKNGGGSLKLRGSVHHRYAATGGRGEKVLTIHEVPYGVNKSTLVEQIAEIVLNRKMALLADVRDLSTEEVRVDLVMKKDADEAKVLAYLHKNTSLEVNVQVNLTCLVPTENPEVAAPLPRADLKTILWHFLHFRHRVVTRRLQNELEKLLGRLHILDGFALIFDALDEILRIIRASDGKADAAEKIQRRFDGLDAEQTDAILELKLYRLARLEIHLVEEERGEKRARADEVEALLADDDGDTGSGRWGIVRNEIEEILDTYGKKHPRGPRRTKLGDVGEEAGYSEEDFIVAEDCHIVVTADGWIKRQKEVKDPSTTRLREGDRVLAAVAGSTRATLGLFSSAGTCYTVRMIDVPASTGHGEPIQKLFKLRDGERIVAAVSFDPRLLPAESLEGADGAEPAFTGFAATDDGHALRFGLSAFAEVSTRSGRRYARPAKGAAVVAFGVVDREVQALLAVSRRCRAKVVKPAKVPFLSGPGKGNMLLKLVDDALLGVKLSRGDRDLLTYETSRGATDTVSTVKYEATETGGRGVEVKKNGTIVRIVPEPVEAPPSW
ncbi:DNA topoisomerase (ATP-hydrolyzing) [Phycisphaera mikurensis]|uniref:DNA topoisomerase IV subunit A n=1 Tax=Phycisphaera mikurensis (strain NBRC 102666 / KCTC 22515 / FYK2301M01) TaxID=1142394 RepID=I0IAJ2_PHYMF|nr:DNA topoisomerase (ATP-hydrolyzing) [Phycisphaera mikurensis]MBB6441723.1 DNA gyrase subunit A [Phycisphaera mikurensis]BAM02280.1 DNA topoisomerase IV subunit A [Phycisphaera mikurensis NBRC 102666]